MFYNVKFDQFFFYHLSNGCRNLKFIKKGNGIETRGK